MALISFCSAYSSCVPSISARFHLHFRHYSKLIVYVSQWHQNTLPIHRALSEMFVNKIFFASTSTLSCQGFKRWKKRNQINFKFLVNEPITYSIKQSVKRISDNQSINCMKSFQILKDNNVAITCSHLGMSLATILVYMSQDRLWPSLKWGALSLKLRVFSFE